MVRTLVTFFIKLITTGRRRGERLKVLHYVGQDFHLEDGGAKQTIAGEEKEKKKWKKHKDISVRPALPPTGRIQEW
jgi:hypothetical protein